IQSKFMDRIINNIKYFRKLKDLSQSNLAELLKIERSSYSKIESGTTEITMKRFLEIAKILERKPEDFFCQDPSMVPAEKFASEGIKVQIQTLKSMCDKNEILIQTLQENIAFLKERIDGQKNNTVYQKSSTFKKKK
ncbi:MAG: helix-turn-helix transcriptional regulator, partial [Bacteroidota bacterium]